MVRRQGLELDKSLYEGRGGRDGRQGIPRLPRGRADNALAVVLVLTVALVVLMALTYKKENWWAVVLIGVLFFVSELFALRIKGGGRLSIALLPVVMVMMISGPIGAAVVVLFGIPAFYMERGEQGLRKVLYNTAQLLFSAGVAAWVFRHTGGETIDAALKTGGKLVLPWILAIIMFFVFNTLLVALVLTPEGDRLARFWQRRLLRKSPGYLLYGGIGFLAAILYVKLEYTAVVLLFAPLVAIRVLYTRYATMRDVCDNTTLAVMEAVERRGMFMEGHSLGVADMAVAIADEMEFAEEDIHFLRQAALLHDVGKLALDPAIVNKAGPLTPEEYQEIKKHPLVAANIVSKEPSFEVVAPAIRHHHEMADGSGYVDGLAGDTIPVGARILAVSDAFDAMQRPTAFRDPLTPYQAVSEVVRAKGIQYDPDVVEAFTKVVTRRGLWSGSLKEKVRMPKAKTAAQQPGLIIEPEQMTLAEDAGAEAQTRETPSGATPAEGIKYTEVRSEIEKDIREWERSDVARSKRRVRGEPRRRAVSRKKKGQEDTGPRG
jgi:putative nucleotidyltransferase with HDIG domain